MEVIEIPTTVLLEVMLKKLGLPKPEYKARMSGEAKLVTSVTFFPATRCLGFSYGTISLAGDPLDSPDAADDDAAKKAIKYMETVEHKILKDYSYDQLHQKKLTENHHIFEVIENNRKTSKIIREKDQQIKKITKYWDNFILNVSNTNDKVTQIAESGYTVGSSQLDNDINSTLWEVQKGTAHIDQLTFESTDLLHKVGKFPYDTDTDSSETDQFPGYYPSPSPSPTESDDLCAMDYLYL